ncbi:GDSL-type esterase/lipase family protein [Terriglobus sp. TAA 43]|uniref:GDSL-type esterase/lipase family protein n=1 Tax=Terriglobus sp. TAA 43 TaxID=278961 RepID=UPI00068BEE91|nr:GDSL-type esterase/lipase family protein [Terriglobus sp. TAA 43]
MRVVVCVVMLVLSGVGMAQTTLPANSADADFSQSRRYRDDDLHAKARVVFLGDSIMDYWGSHNGKWFSYTGWINRGIGGQTTQQLLLRERHDVLDLHPQAVVLEGGSNDMRLGFSPEEIRDNILSMGELAQANGLKVYVVQMTPVCDCVRPLTGLRTVEHIHHLNELLVAMAQKKHWDVLDFNSPLEDAEGKMRAELTVDGVHPNDRGYELLAPVVERALVRYTK